MGDPDINKPELTTSGKQDKETRNLILQFVLFHVATATVSMVLTESAAALQGVRVLLLPIVLILRLCTLALFTFPAFLVPWRRSGVLLMSSFWLVWQGISCGRVTESVLMFILLTGAAAFVFFKYEREAPVTNWRYTPFFRKMSAVLLISFVFIFIVEIIQTGSFLTPLKSMLATPDILACNLLYFTSLGSFVIWIWHPALGTAIYLAIWIALAISSLFKHLNIVEPLMVPDVFQAVEGLTAAFNIMGVFGIIGIVLAVAAVVFLLVLLVKKTRKQKFRLRSFIISLIITVVGVSTCLLSTKLPWISFSADSTRELFDRNGYVYSFITTGYRFLNIKPKNYDKSEVEKLRSRLAEERVDNHDADTEVKNIIVIQLESFVDPYRIEGAAYGRDPIPFLRSLTDKYTSGTLVSPTFGGQTIRSEFEFLTGLSLENLPYGYIPYTMELKDYPADSLPRYLESVGFGTAAIHNYQGEFFRRNYVYDSLGFDRYASYEFMPGVQKRSGDIWANDSILLDQIKLALDTSGKDKNFIFTVSVQAHGSYPVMDEEEFAISIDGLYDRTLVGKLGYYIGELEQVDAAMKSICEYFEERGEPTLIVMYSDHLPTFARDIPGIPLENRFIVNMYSWNNMGLPKDKVNNLQMNLLSTYICDMLGLEGGEINTFHRTCAEDENYVEEFTVLQYYKLFEEYKDVDFENEGYVMGFEEFRFDSITQDSESGVYLITGSGLTDNVEIFVNGKGGYETEFIDSHTLRYHAKKELKPGDKITIKIIGEKFGGVLRESEEHEWR
ncbi:MAG: LTA synthase family protein [Clostridia bacterium]|nr:LTA synthase family protein [Clostridia bacterium]